MTTVEEVSAAQLLRRWQELKQRLDQADAWAQKNPKTRSIRQQRFVAFIELREHEDLMRKVQL